LLINSPRLVTDQDLTPFTLINSPRLVTDQDLTPFTYNALPVFDCTAAFRERRDGGDDQAQIQQTVFLGAMTNGVFNYTTQEPIIRRSAGS